jgi:N-acetylglucosamine malate deacetylase 1
MRKAMLTESACRVLVLGAHPDDAEVAAGGLLVRHRQLGSVVRIISVTDGRSGHHQRSPDDLVHIRREEARKSGELIGAEYLTWNFPDGELQADLKVRSAIIREIRAFKADLVLTHRPNDYHPDHRAVGQAVQDASYMVTVPHICPNVPALRSDPVVAYMSDLFTRPNSLRPDIVLDIADEFESVVRMAACHHSQFFEWLPYHDGKLQEVPASDEAQLAWLHVWLTGFLQHRWIHFQSEVCQRVLHASGSPLIEVYEISEYAGQLREDLRAKLFPGSL